MTVWLNPDEVARRLSVSRKTAISIMHQMPHSVIGGTVRQRIRVSEGSLDAWMMKKSNIVPVINTGNRKKLTRR
jgi:hypothetical protein